MRMVMSDDDQSPQKPEPEYKRPQGSKMGGSNTWPGIQFGGIKGYVYVYVCVCEYTYRIYIYIYTYDYTCLFWQVYTYKDNI